MSNFLLIFCLFPLYVAALEGTPVDDGSATGDPFVQGTMLPRMLASEANFTAYVPSVKNGLIISNPGMERASFYLIGVKPDGTQTRKFMMVAPGQTRTLTPKILSFADELYVVSLQHFEAVLPMGKSTKDAQVISVRKPSNPLPLFQIQGNDGSRTTVAKDKKNNVYFPAYPFRVGIWDKDEQAVIQDDGTILPLMK